MSRTGALFTKKKPDVLVPEPTTREIIWWQREPMAQAEKEIRQQMGWQAVIYFSTLIVGVLLGGRYVHGGWGISGGFILSFLFGSWDRRYNRLLDKKRDKAIGDQRIRTRILEECDRSTIGRGAGEYSIGDL